MASIVGYTKAKMDTMLALLAPLASPAFTGNPTAPTQTSGDTSTKIATTAFAMSAAASAASSAVASFAPLASPALTGNPTAPTQTAANNSTRLATTAYVDTADNLKAPLASPALTGSPTAPTQTPGDNSTKVATTAYVDVGKIPVVNAQTGTAYTLVLTDARKVIEVTNASANTLTVPPNSAVAFPIGTELRVTQTGAGKTTVTAGAGVTINSPGGLLGARVQWSTVTLRKRATDTWVLSDDVG